MNKHPIAYALFLVLLGTGPGCAREEGQAASQARAISVTVARTQARPLRVTTRVTGEIVSLADPEIAAELDGRVVAIHADEGERVQAGQMLAEQDAEPHAIELEKSQAEVKRLQAMTRDHRRTVRRLRDLLDKQSTAQNELDRAETELDASLAELDAAQARVKDARYRLARTGIASPIDGSVQLRRASVGDYLKKGDPIFQLVATDRLRARLYFSESLAPQVSPGMQVRLWAGDRAQSIDAAVARVRPMLDPGNRALVALVDFGNPGGWLPGYSITAEVVLAEKEQAIMAPVLSLVRRPAGTVVYMVSGGTVRQQPVETGSRDGDWIEITAGVGADETLALDGAAFLTDGAAINIRSKAP